MKKIVVVALCLIALTYALPTAAFAQTAASAEAQEHILSQLRRARIPNAAVAVIRGGETSYILKDSERDTLFEIGSVAKPFTAFGVLLLEDMGLLSLSDPVNWHLPWFEARYRGAPVPHGDITVYNLLQHTSGLTHDERRFPTFSVGTADEFVSRYAGIELAFYPSAQFNYSNANYVILGLLIEAASGLSYDEFMTRHVLRPLGLYDTFTDIQNARATGRTIGGHRRGFLQQLPFDFAHSPISIPSGHIYSSIADMARWAGIHLGLVDVPEQFARIVQRSRENIHGSANPFAELEFFHAAGGWVIWGESGGIEHNGVTPGYFAVVRVLDAQDTAIVVLGNLGIFPVTINRLGDIVADAAIHGAFGTVSMDFYAIIDIMLVGVIIWGVFSLCKFARLLIRTARRIRGGEKIKYGGVKPKWIFDTALALAFILAIYVVLPNIFSLPLVLIALSSPAVVVAIVFAWIDLAHSLFGLWVKAFVAEKVQRQHSAAQ